MLAALRAALAAGHVGGPVYGPVNPQPAFSAPAASFSDPLTGGTANWTEDIGSIVSNVNGFNGGTTGSNLAHVTSQAGLTDCFAEATINVGPVYGSGVALSVAARVSASNAYILSMYEDGAITSPPQLNVQLLRLDGTVLGPSGFAGQLGYRVTSFANGDKLRLECLGSRIVAYYNDYRIFDVIDTTLTTGGPGVWIFQNAQGAISDFKSGPITAISSDARQTLTSFPPNNATDNGGGAFNQYILKPSSPDTTQPHRLVVVLPVQNPDTFGQSGDPTTVIYGLNAHNWLNATFAFPQTNQQWICDGSGYGSPPINSETWLTTEYLPWLKSTYGKTPEDEVWLVGFSRSGYAALTMMLRHPTLFDRAACFDFPYSTQTNATNNGATYGSADFTGSYELLNMVPNASLNAPFVARKRLFICGYQVFKADVQAIAADFNTAGVKFDQGSMIDREHYWPAGWLQEALIALADQQYAGD